MRARGRRQSRARATPPLSPPHALLGDVTRARARTCIDGCASVLPVASEGAEGSRRGRRQRRRERATAARPRPRARKRAPPRRRVPICSRLHASAVSCISIMLAAGWATAWPAAVARGRECDDNRSTLLPNKCTNQPSSLLVASHRRYCLRATTRPAPLFSRPRASQSRRPSSVRCVARQRPGLPAHAGVSGKRAGRRRLTLFRRASCAPPAAGRRGRRVTRAPRHRCSYAVRTGV